jgi:hypothetical protein
MDMQQVTGQVILTLPRGSAAASTACCAASASISIALQC